MTPERKGILDLDLRGPVPDLAPAEDGQGLLVVLRAGTTPLGQLDLCPSDLPMSAGRLRQSAAAAVAPAVGQRLLGPAFDPPLPERRPSRSAVAPPAASACALRDPIDALATVRQPVGSAGPGFSVIVCTRDRPAQLEGTLQALSRQTLTPAEVVVVDNAPTDTATRLLVERWPAVRYVLEPRPGLSTARNTGIRESCGELIAFTDDDARPAPSWLAWLATAFGDDPTVGVVTGLVLPESLADEGARAFEAMGGFGQGYRRRDHDASFFDGMRTRGVPVWRLGAGADMAVRRRVLDLVGGFDERLGAGAAGCSEDSELWHRVLAAGFTCRYEPAAEVLHQHRGDLDGVRRQATAYMRGHVAALAVQYARRRHSGDLRRAVASLPRYYAGRSVRAVLRGAGSDPTLRAEVRGYVQGVREAARILRSDLRPPGEGAPGLAPRASVLAQNPFPHRYTEGFYFREKMRAITRVAPDDRVRRVLEVGGGQSGLTSVLYPCAHVVSIDLDASFGAAGPNRRPRQVFLGADATRLPFQDASFDLVTCFDVLEHIDEDQRALDEVLRVLAPGGTLLVTSPNDRWRFPYHRPFRLICPTDRQVMAEWGHVRRGYTTAALEDLVGQPVTRWATFIGPITVVAHDLAFSRLPSRVRRAAISALSPVVWTAYGLHRPHAPGTETAWAWRLPLAPAVG